MQFLGVPGFGNLDTFLEYPCDGPATSNPEPELPIVNGTGTAKASKAASQ